MHPTNIGTSEASALTALDTTKDKYNTGAGASSECPRAGAVILQTRGGSIREVYTTCNTWSCIACRDRNLGRFKGIVKSGCSTLGRCSFITITYKEGSERLRDAGCVQKDWTALMRRLKKSAPWTQRLQYLRVTELTKKGTPHVHAIIGTIPSEKMINCWKRGDFQIKAYRAGMASCQCVSHDFARGWSAVTDEESYICFAVPVTSAAGAAGYLGKYLGKTMFQGMGRRFAKSNGWPSEKRRRLLPGPEGFARVLWTPGGAPRDLEGKWDDIPRSGDEDQRRESRRIAARKLVKLGEQNVHIT